jgi:ankyrin repeat protein
VNAALHDGATPLHSACENGFHKIVKLLVTSGATVNTLMTNSGNTFFPMLSHHSQVFLPSTPLHFEATLKLFTH